MEENGIIFQLPYGELIFSLSFSSLWSLAFGAIVTKSVGIGGSQKRWWQKEALQRSL